MKTIKLTLTTALIVLSIGCFAQNSLTLSGTYTIGTSAHADFKSIAEAIIILETDGVSGPVTFKVEKETYDPAAIISDLQKVAVMGNIAFINVDEDNSMGANAAMVDTETASK